MMNKGKMCKCQCGGALLTPAMIKMLQRPYQRFNTLQVKRKPKQQGMGHCGCQHGGNIFSDIGSALTGAFHDPLRGLAAVATLGASEVIAIPADIFQRTTGVKASTVLDKTAPLIGPIAGPEAAMGAKATSFGLKQVGLGKKKRRGRPKKRVPAKKRKTKKR